MAENVFANLSLAYLSILLAMLSNNFKPELISKYYCVNCDYTTGKKSNIDSHFKSKKHKSMISNDFKPDLSPKYSCNNCGRTYKDNSGLWRHNKKCSCKDNFVKTCINDTTKQQQLIDYLLKENAEFRQLMIDQNNQMMELAKNSGNNNNTTNNNTTNNNNNFNLNFFLNETCKNAMNIKDFISQLQVGIKELEDTGRLGFAEGISKIFINGLKNIEINDRPIHCSDSKREVVYIKDNNQWNKDTEDNPLLTNAIKQVARKNIKQISEWTKDNPKYNDSSSKQNDTYLKIVSEAMSGSSIDESNKNYSKIIKNIAKETVIDKVL